MFEYSHILEEKMNAEISIEMQIYLNSLSRFNSNITYYSCAHSSAR